jgi:hypothetical protein
MCSQGKLRGSGTDQALCVIHFLRADVAVLATAQLPSRRSGRWAPWGPMGVDRDRVIHVDDHDEVWLVVIAW